MTKGEDGKKLWFERGDDLIRHFVPKAYPLSQDLLRDLAAAVNKHFPPAQCFGNVGPISPEEIPDPETGMDFLDMPLLPPSKKSLIDLLWGDLSYLLPHYIADVWEETGTEPDWSDCKPLLDEEMVELAKNDTLKRWVVIYECRDIKRYISAWIEETAEILKAMGALSAELEASVEEVRKLAEEKERHWGIMDAVKGLVHAEGEKTRKVFNAKFSQEQPTTQKQRAALFGVDRKTIARWEKPPKGKTSSAPEGYDPWLPMEALRIAGIKYRASAEALKRISMKKAEAEIAAEEAQED